MNKILELPDKEAFVEELKSGEIKEAKVSVNGRGIEAQGFSLPSFRRWINLTALSDGHVLRTTISQADVMYFDEKGRKKQEEGAWAIVDKLKEELKEDGIELKPGEWIPGVA